MSIHAEYANFIGASKKSTWCDSISCCHLDNLYKPSLTILRSGLSFFGIPSNQFAFNM